MFRDNKTVSAILFYYALAVFTLWGFLLFGMFIYLGVLLLLIPMSSPFQFVIPTIISIYVVVNKIIGDKAKWSMILFFILVIHLVTFLNMYLSILFIEAIASSA